MSIKTLLRRNAAKIDHLEKMKGFAQTPEGRAAIHMLRTRYPEQGDRAFPVLFREYQKGHETGGEQGIVLSPGYLEHHRLMDAYRESDPAQSANYEEQLNGDRPDAYFWNVHHDDNGEPRYRPVQPGMVGNLGRMLRWMKAHNHPQPNMDSKATSLTTLQAMYKDWKAKFDRDRDPTMGTVVHTFPDQWTLRTCDNPDQCYDEGEEMDHCGAKYAPMVEKGTHTLYSLRDPQNWPHASFVYRPGENVVEDLRGKHNSEVADKYAEYLKSYFPLLGEGVTIGGHPDPSAPPIPGVEKYGLPVTGPEAQRIASLIAIRQGAVGAPTARNERVAWVLVADKLNDFLRGKVYETEPCPDCQGKGFVVTPDGQKTRCPNHANHIPGKKNQVHTLGADGEPIIKGYNQPEFGDPNHPDYPSNSAMLGELEKAFHSDENDALFPFLVHQFKSGDLRLGQPTREQEWYNPETENYEMRHPPVQFERRRGPEEIEAAVHDYMQGMRDRGYGDDVIHQHLQNRIDRDERFRGWAPIEREEVDKYGDWLANANSQNPSRHGLKVPQQTHLPNGDVQTEYVPHPRWPNPLDLNNTSWEELAARREEYDTWLHAKQSKDRAIWKSNDGQWHVVSLTPEECAREGQTMQNCIRDSYSNRIADGTSLIYSLRDHNANPRADMEILPKKMWNPKTREEMDRNAWAQAKQVAVGRNVRCDDCRGNGYQLELDENGDPVRGGPYNDIQYPRDEDGNYIPCPTCDGRGSRREDPNEEEVARLEQFQGSPLDGTVQQIQGKQNRPPLHRYHAPIKEFFGTFPQDRLPKWGITPGQTFRDFNSMFNPENQGVIMYHPGDYGLPDPNLNTDYQGLVRSYLDSHSRNDDPEEADRFDRRRARFLHDWATWHGQTDQLRNELEKPETEARLREIGTQGFDPFSHEDMHEWERANPNPRQEVPEQPNYFDENGEYRDQTPEFQAELANYQREIEQSWQHEEAWQHQREQIANQIRENVAGDAWKQTPQAKMYQYAMAHVNGEALPVPVVNDEGQHVAKAYRTAEWCICGKCEPEWNFRLSNEELWRKVRNMLRKNNIANDDNMAAWERMSQLYPEHGHLGEFLHREFRKGRLKMPVDEQSARLERNLQSYQRNRQEALDTIQRLEAENPDSYHVREWRENLDYYDRKIAEAQARLDGQETKFTEGPLEVPQAAGQRAEKLTPEMMRYLSEVVTKTGQREKGWNILKQEIGPLFQQAKETKEEDDQRRYGGHILHTFPDDHPNYPGWTIRYIDHPTGAEMESKDVGHCIKHYGDRIVGGDTHNYNLKDPKGKSHATWELTVPENPLDWDRISAGMPNYDMPPKHKPRLCPKCQSPLTAAGVCPRDGFTLNPTADRMHAVWARWMANPKAHDAYGTHKFSPESAEKFPGEAYGGAITHEGPEGQEAYDYLIDARQRGLIDPPPLGTAELRQITGKGGSMGYKPAIKEWMDTLPWAERPLGRAGYGTNYISRPQDLPDPNAPEEQAVDEYGFRLPAAARQVPDWNSLAQNMGDPAGEYDPALGQRVYNYAQQDPNHLHALWAQLNQWGRPGVGSRNILPNVTCLGCHRAGYVSDTGRPPRPGINYLGEGDSVFYCDWCGHRFLGNAAPQNGRQGPQYTPYQAQAVQHLAPLLGQHQELLDQAYPGEFPAPAFEPPAEQQLPQNFARQATMEPGRPATHYNFEGEPCNCLWAGTHPDFDQRQASWEVISDSDWGEDADSGMGQEADHFPMSARPNEPDSACPVCGDPMRDGDCPRCDWGGWQGMDAIRQNPTDPTRDLKSPVQG